jgi:hypothetical protein
VSSRAANQTRVKTSRSANPALTCVSTLAPVIGNRATNRLLTTAKARDAQTLQRFAVVKHEYQTLESPVHTVVSWLAARTGVAPNTVRNDLRPALLGGYAAHLDTPDLDRPDRVVAWLDQVPSSANRKTDNKGMQTQIGKLGSFEDALRTWTGGPKPTPSTTYEGGHLLGYQFARGVAHWSPLNQPSNLAPQDERSNRLAGSMWDEAETIVSGAVGLGKKVLYEASVTYPDRSYTVTANGMLSVLTAGSPTENAVLAQSFPTRFLPTTVHTWTPSQYLLTVTPTSLPAVAQLASMPGVTYRGLIDATSWLILARPLAPARATLHRLIPLIRGISVITPAGANVVEAQGHQVYDAVSEAKQLVFDLSKVFALTSSALWLTGYSAADVLALIPSTVLSSLEAICPMTFWNSTPLLALVIYLLAHQLNIARVLPGSRNPLVGWVKYILQAAGL